MRLIVKVLVKASMLVAKAAASRRRHFAVRGAQVCLPGTL
jgi:hypothetical protein